MDSRDQLGDLFSEEYLDVTIGGEQEESIKGFLETGVLLCPLCLKEYRVINRIPCKTLLMDGVCGCARLG